MPRGTNPSLDQYLSLVFPWGNEHVSLYKCVTWTFFKDNEKLFVNTAAQSFDQLLTLIERRAARPNSDMYVALGTMRMAKADMTADGYPKAIRKVPNMASFNSVYIDIDVGKEGGYANRQDAYDALDDFIDQYNLPDPTMEVNSGGGLHVYWCCNAPIPVNNWIPLSRGLQAAALTYGLKFDPQVTVNPAGILRIPGTYNWKTIPPRPVVLLQDSSFQTYDYQQLVGAFGAYSAPATAGNRLTVVGNQQMKFTNNFTANVQMNSAPVRLDDVAVNCPAITDTLNRGGKGDAEPLWNLMLYAASFTDDPHGAAYALSDQDPRFTKDGTDKKLAEKIAARAADPNAGWPSCQSFSVLSPQCATCPLFAQGKSPFNFARRPAVQAQIQQFTQAAAQAADPLIPPDYWRDHTNHVFTTIVDKDGNAHVIDVLRYPLLDGGIDALTGDVVLKTVLSGSVKWCPMNIAGNMTPTPAAQAMAASGVYMSPENFVPARNFMLAWLKHLQTTRRYVDQSNFGWDRKGGFTYDDKRYTPGQIDLVFRGTSADRRFAVEGELAPWQNAMQLVYGNAPLETLVATSFAAPLVEIISMQSLVVSCFSAASGVGKSTAMALAQAVWGDPRTGMSVLDDTYNSTLKKISDLRHLPMYWDEIRTRDGADKVVSLIFGVTQGKAKSRLRRDATQAEAEAFTTMMIAASNYGLADTVYAHTEATEAGGLRLFEFEADTITNSRFADHQARELIVKVQRNYGSAGALYAEFLANNRPIIEKVLAKTSGELAAQYQFEQKERFWGMTMATIIVGAQLANAARLTNFDVDLIKRFLGETVLKLRGGLKAQSHTTLATGDDVLSLMDDLKQELRGRNLLITDVIPYPVQGRVPVVKVVDTVIDRLQDVWMQVGAVDGRIRLRVNMFYPWLRERHQNPTNIERLLSQHYFITKSKQGIGAGVPGLNALASTARSMCVDLTPIPKSGPTSL